MTTNAARLLDSLGIRYELREYEVVIDSADYLRATGATLGSISREP
jgi:hypothetical protein